MLAFLRPAALCLCLTLALSPSTGSAQFKKYKSKSRFNKKEGDTSTKAFIDQKKNSAPVVKVTPGGDDVFGRGSDNAAADSPSDPKYVNLNPETAFGPEVVTSFDFPNTSLIDLTKFMQKLTGINLILDKELKGKITILAPTAITVGDAWKAYLTALNLNGYTLVKSGSFYKIVNARDIRYTPTKIYTGNYTPDTENYVMRILPLKNIDSTEVTRSFRPFMSRYGRIIDIKQTNTIIVQDTGSNINRLVRLIKFIDVPGHEETLQIIKVRYSSAQEIAKLLDQILKSGGSSSSKKFSSSSAAKKGETISKIIAEPRTNSIIAMANADGAKRLRALINRLDVKGIASNSGRIHVYYLNYGDSETLAKTLSSLVSAAKTTSKTSRFSKGATSENNSLFNNEVKITADKDNNALVVTASPTDYLTVKSVISKLDIPRDQVYVEGLMMETQVNRNRGFGISILGAYGSGNARKAGFTGGTSDLVNLLTNNITSLGGLFVGAGVGRTVEFDPGTGSTIQINSVNALITAIATNSDTNVLATPQILALDNTEAVFEVGESIPTPERTNSANGSSTVAIKQQKVGLTLKITPQINKVTRFVKLKIDQKIQDFSNRALPDGVSADGVATVERAAVTTVVVRDRDTIAMGGLMRDKEVSTESKVPLLGDIPILGWLFKNTRNAIEKVNLLFFLTPKILDAKQVAAAKTVKDLLNRRAVHLQEVVGDEDSFKGTVKGLYEKANRQEKGPLYNAEDAARYEESNSDSKGIKNNDLEEDDDINLLDEEVPASSYVAPDYKTILDKVKTKKASTVRKKK
ncbi:MAG: type II secretion system protein GspD [Halobacteriovorax sp.]|nr:type II secretion system protein GspD [Halobacteriovorax sp.]|tara:strand:- start:42767 stop:45184 length:2418 start_codon:yes stop_codon:yes gene_type:complete